MRKWDFPNSLATLMPNLKAVGWPVWNNIIIFILYVLHLQSKLILFSSSSRCPKILEDCTKPVGLKFNTAIHDLFSPIKFKKHADNLYSCVVRVHRVSATYVCTSRIYAFFFARYNREELYIFYILGNWIYTHANNRRGEFTVANVRSPCSSVQQSYWMKCTQNNSGQGM